MGDSSDGTPITVLTRLFAKDGCEAELAGRLARLAESVRSAEPDCSSYRLLRSAHDEQHFVIVECYRDAAALDAHANSPHLREAIPALMECLVQPPELAIYGDS